MNTHKHPHTSILALAALLALPVGLQAAVEANQPGPDSAGRSYTNRDPQAPVDLNGDGSVDLRLNTHTATDAIEATGFAARDQAIGLAERGASEGRMIAGAIETGAARLETELRADVQKAMRKADEARDRLNQAIERGRNSTERRWDNARDEIADRYEDFARALEKARDKAVESGARLDLQGGAPADGSAHRS